MALGAVSGCGEVSAVCRSMTIMPRATTAHNTCKYSVSLRPRQHRCVATSSGLSNTVTSISSSNLEDDLNTSCQQWNLYGPRVSGTWPVAKYKQPLTPTLLGADCLCARSDGEVNKEPTRNFGTDLLFRLRVFTTAFFFVKSTKRCMTLPSFFGSAFPPERNKWL